MWGYFWLLPLRYKSLQSSNNTRAALSLDFTSVPFKYLLAACWHSLPVLPATSSALAWKWFWWQPRQQCDSDFSHERAGTDTLHRSYLHTDSFQGAPQHFIVRWMYQPTKCVVNLTVRRAHRAEEGTEKLFSSSMSSNSSRNFSHGGSAARKASSLLSLPSRHLLLFGSKDVLEPVAIN